LHEAALSGNIHFGQFEDLAPATFPIDAASSRFRYLIINRATGEAQMQYHIEFTTNDRRRFKFDGVKYMQKDASGLVKSIQDLLADYTTLYCHLTDENGNELGIGYLKFRTFEDLAATASLAAFLASFRITGTSDPLIQLQARLRFLAFTAQFVQREYDPLGFVAAVGR